MESLTSDLIAHIGYYLDDYTDRLRCLESSKLFYSISADYVFHSMTFTNDLSRLEEFDQHFRYILKIKPRLSSLMLTFSNISEHRIISNKIRIYDKIAKVKLIFEKTPGVIVQSILDMFDVDAIAKVCIHHDIIDDYAITTALASPVRYSIKLVDATLGHLQYDYMSTGIIEDLLLDISQRETIIDFSKVNSQMISMTLRTLDVFINDFHKVTKLTIDDTTNVIGDQKFIRQIERAIADGECRLEEVFSNYHYPWTCHYDHNFWYQMIRLLPKTVKYHFNPIGDPTFMTFLGKCRKLGVHVNIWCYTEKHYIEACLINLLLGPDGPNYDIVFHHQYTPSMNFDSMSLAELYGHLPNHVREMYFWIEFLLPKY